MDDTNKMAKVPVIELIGDVPPTGRWFCAVCCMIYLGTVSADMQVQQAAQEAVKRAIAEHEELVPFLLPDRPDKPLRIAVTIAPSVYFPEPGPVCWVHMQGYAAGNTRPSAQAVNPSRLILGKAHQTIPGTRP